MALAIFRRAAIAEYWSRTYWLVSFIGVLVTSYVNLAIRTRSSVRIRQCADDLVERFYSCGLRQRIKGTYRTDIYYHIGLLGRYDWQENIYTIEVSDKGTPVKSIHFHIGSTVPGKDRSPFDRLMELSFQAEDITQDPSDGKWLNVVTIPYDAEAGRAFISLCFTPSIQPGPARTFRVTFRRPQLWKTLRKTGKDRGSYSPGPGPPEVVTLNFVPPRGISTDSLSVKLSREAAEGGLPVPQKSDCKRLGRPLVRWELDTAALDLDKYSYDVHCDELAGNTIKRILLAFVYRKKRLHPANKPEGLPPRS